MARAKGRPALFNSVEEFEDSVEQYFEYIKGEVNEEGAFTRNPEPPTITGMCLFLGFESRQSFHDYLEKSNFSYAVKKARLRIECEYEKALYGKFPTGPIFALKNMGWADKQEVKHEGIPDPQIAVTIVKPDAQ